MQEWSPLLQQPSRPWSHPFITTWTDARGTPRGSLNLSLISRTIPHTLEMRTGAAALGSSRAGFTLHPLVPAEMILDHLLRIVITPQAVIGWNHLDILVASRDRSLRFGTPVIFVDGTTGPLVTFELLANITVRSTGTCAISFSSHPDWGNLTGPSSPQERKDLATRSRNSCPGISGWKNLFILLFPSNVQDAYWDSLDAQRSSSILDPPLGVSRQVHLDKPCGGFRPISLLEESLKAIEGLLARRKTEARSRLESDTIYCNLNLCGEKGTLAAQEAMYTDSMVCEDANLHSSEFARVLHDEVKFFNAIQRAAIDAIEEARGVPEAARATLQASLHFLHVCVNTKWGMSPPIHTERGALQGMGGAPEASKPAQDVKLRIRASSPAFYVTHFGRKVYGTAYADDGRHYATNAAQLRTAQIELSEGGKMSGNASNPGKSAAYARNWDEYCASHQGIAEGFTPLGIRVASYDIFSGETVTETLPRAHLDTPDTFLGKGGSIQDRHSVPAAALLAKMQTFMDQLSWQRASWDEIALSAQWQLGGHINYCSLIGIPDISSLHLVDSRLQSLLLRALRVRPSAEHHSCLAPYSVGGLQTTSVVECTVGAVARDLMNLLNGSGMASSLARDSLRHAMSALPLTPAILSGTVCRSIRHLAAYGIYLSTAPDRSVGRILDKLHERRHLRCLSLAGPYNSADEKVGLRFCRVGPLANGIRNIVTRLRNANITCHNWHRSPILRHSKALTGIPRRRLQEAISLAVLDSQNDWSQELHIFQPACTVPHPPEDWDPSSWENPDLPAHDRRSRLLDRACPSHLDREVGMFSDGSYTHSHGATFAADCRAFAEDSNYHAVTEALALPTVGRLPTRFGHELSTIHTAEIVGGLIALRARRRGCDNLLVVDRSAFFAILNKAFDPFHKRNKGPLGPLEARIHHIMWELRQAWHPPLVRPCWRLHLQAFPELWNKTGVSPPLRRNQEVVPHRLRRPRSGRHGHQEPPNRSTLLPNGSPGPWQHQSGPLVRQGSPPPHA